MREIRIEKVTVNIGCGEGGEPVEKAIKLLETMTGRKAIKTVAKSNSKTFNLRPGVPIGAKVTLRGETAMVFLKRALAAVGNKVPPTSFDGGGNFSFGVGEYLNVPGMKYDPSIGIIGFEVAVTLFRRGYRVKRRQFASSIGKKHIISSEDAQTFVQKVVGAEIGERERYDIY